MSLDVESFPNMPRNWSKAVPEGNELVSQQEEFGSDQSTLADIYRMVEELFDKSDRNMDQLTEKMRGTRQRVASLEQVARQPRVTMEADVPADEKTRERTEGATLKQFKRCMGIAFLRTWSIPTQEVLPASVVTPPNLRLSVFKDDALVGNDAAAPKPCFSPLEMRSPTAAGGLLRAGKASTTTRITFYQARLRFCLTEETNLRTSILYAWYYSSFYLRAALSWRRVIETKSGQNRMLDPSGSKGRLHACPFLETWRALLCGEVMRSEAGWGCSVC